VGAPHPGSLTLPAVDALGHSRYMTTSTNDLAITTESVTSWVDRYLTAWRTNDPDDIAGLFTEDGEYHEGPYETDETKSLPAGAAAGTGSKVAGISTGRSI
jgi:hypothetical protein